MHDTGGDPGDRARHDAFADLSMVRVLGPCVVDPTPHAASAGESSELSGIQRKILSRLALARPGSIGVEELTEAIWDQTPPATARTAIHNQISRIRTRLGPDMVVTDGARYSLGTTTDVEAAGDALTSVEAFLSNEQFSEASLLVETAMDWWRGIPLDELGELDEARRERVRLGEVYRSLETMRLEAALGTGRFGWAVPEAERLVDDTPDDEYRWILLVRALGAAGRRGDALGAYERARRELADRLGLEPGPQLRMAESAILDGKADAGPHGADARLVGKNELIDDALALCDSGAPVLLVGETGIGKTRVLQEICRRLRRNQVTVATARCSLHPDTAVATLEELATSLGEVLDPALPPVAAFSLAVRRSLAGDAQIVLVVDDLDRAGPTSVQALEVAAGIDGVGLIAAATETDLLPEELIGATLSVGSLDEDELVELVGVWMDAQHPLDESDVQWLIEMSGGNPAILEHLLEDPLRREVARRMTIGSNELPPSSDALREVVWRRIDRLGMTTRSTLEVAAVLGATCPADLLATLAAERGIAGAVAAALLTEMTADDERKWLTFRHGAIQRILYDDLSPGRRMEIHHRAAGLLRAAGSPKATIASHALASAEVDPISAVADTFGAARAAIDHGAHGDAARWYERALEVIDRTGASERLRVEAMVGLGDCLRLAGSPLQEAALLDAADAAFALGDEILIGDAVFAVLQLGVTTESGQLHQRAIDLADRALAAVEGPDQRALIAGGASLAHSMTGDSELCRELFITSEAAAQSEVTRRCVLPFAYLALGHPRDLEQRERITDELLALGRSVDDPIAKFEAFQLAFSVGLQRCDGDLVRRSVAESAQLIEQIGDVGRRWSLAYQQAALAHLDGELELAESLAEDAFDLFAPVSPSRAMAAYGAQLLVIRLAQGRLGEVVDTVEELVADQPGVPAWNAALALAVAPSEPDRAQHHASAALDGVAEDFTWLAAHVIGGRAAATAGDEETRTRYIERLQPYSGQGCWQGTCSYGPVDTVLAMLHSSLGEREMAERHGSLALVGARGLSSPVFEDELDQIDRT